MCVGKRETFPSRFLSLFPHFTYSLLFFLLSMPDTCIDIPALLLLLLLLLSLLIIIIIPSNSNNAIYEWKAEDQESVGGEEHERAASGSAATVRSSRGRSNFLAVNKQEIYTVAACTLPNTRSGCFIMKWQDLHGQTIITLELQLRGEGGRKRKVVELQSGNRMGHPTRKAYILQ